MSFWTRSRNDRASSRRKWYPSPYTWNKTAVKTWTEVYTESQLSIIQWLDYGVSILGITINFFSLRGRVNLWLFQWSRGFSTKNFLFFRIVSLSSMHIIQCFSNLLTPSKSKEWSRYLGESQALSHRSISSSLVSKNSHWVLNPENVVDEGAQFITFRQSNYASIHSSFILLKEHCLLGQIETLLADRLTLAFFCTESPWETHCC